MQKKTLFILATTGVITLVGATVIPIVIINNNNDKKDKEDVQSVIKHLKNLSDKTLKLPSSFKGKIIGKIENKKQIIIEIKKLITTSKLKETSIDVTIKNDVDISSIEKSIIVIVKKGDYKEEFKGLKVKSLIEEENNSKVIEIKDKIKDKDLALPTAADTSDDAKILAAIKAQLKIENDTLIDEDLAKITDNITTLTPGTRTPVTLTITVGTQSDTVDIHVLRPKNVAELDAEVKAIKDKIEDKDLTLPTAADTSDDAKILIAIKAQLKIDNDSLIDEDLEKITDNITTLTPGTRTPVTLTITVGTQSDTVDIHVLRPKTIVELDAEVKAIKDKIEDKDLTLPIAADTSDDAKILIAIKAQLKIDNDSLIDEDLEKITDNITTLTPGTRTPVTLTITVGTQSDTVDIHVLRPKTIVELDAEVKAIKDKIGDKDLTLPIAADTSDDAKILVAIKAQLKIDNDSLIDEDLEKITDSIATLTSGTRTPVTLTITVGTQSDTVDIHVLRPKNVAELDAEVKAIKDKIEDKDLTLPTAADTSDDAKILIAIKAQLKIDNDSLIDEDLEKITDNITTLTSGTRTPVTLTITVGTQSDTVDIHVLRPKTIVELDAEVKAIKDKIGDKDLTLPTTTDITNDGNILTAIRTQLKEDNGDTLSDQELAKITDSIATLTSGTRTPVTLTITVGTQSDTVDIHILRPKTVAELDAEVKAIKDKIGDKDLTLPTAADTSDDAKILIAIKAQLKIDNDSLIDEDLEKITDNITTLTSGTRTPVTLTITVGTQSDTVDIHVLRPKTVAELDAEVKTIKDKIGDKDLTLPTTTDITNDGNILTAIRTQLKEDNGDTLSDQELAKITDNIATLTSGSRTPVTLTITVGTQSDTVDIHVLRPKTVAELDAEVKAIKDKIVDKDLALTTITNSSDDATILAAIRTQLNDENSNTLSNEELSKITADSIPTLILSTKTPITLTITIGTQSDTINIQVTREE